MILFCRHPLSDLCAWSGQFGGTLSGFEFSADGFNGSAFVFLKRRGCGEAFDGRDINRNRPRDGWSR